MSITIIEEKPISMAELKQKLDTIEKKTKELSLRANKTKDYLNQFSKTDPKKTQELIKKIKDLNIPRLKGHQITKIVDILPQDLTELRMIFSGETTTITSENLKKILDAIK